MLSATIQYACPECNTSKLICAHCIKKNAQEVIDELKRDLERAIELLNDCDSDDHIEFDREDHELLYEDVVKFLDRHGIHKIYKDKKNV